MRLGHVTGSVELAEVYGGFGPVPDAITWRGSCIGGCGARPGCREEEPAPECSGCGRLRHGITHAGGPIGRIGPVPARVLPSELGAPTASQLPPAPELSATQVLRSGVELTHDDPSLPPSVRSLLPSCPPGTRLTAAVAHDDAGVLASLALRMPGVGWGVWRRAEGGGWGFSDGALLTPHLRRANVGQLTAALADAEYVPPAPREPIRGCCVACRAEVSITADGKIYKSHKCKVNKTEGRS